MEAKEFRIGNWYNDKRINRDFAVHEIRKHMIDHGDDDYSPTNINDVRGIELTPEWLDRFGFKRQNNAWNGPHKNDFSLWNPPGTDEITFNDTVMCPKIDHIHQLQNLYFALTGRELEIKK